jgi:hypothetical protein
MSAVEYALAALLAGSIAVQAIAAREVARLARTAEMMYSLLYYSAAEAPQQPGAQAAETAAGQQADERQEQPQQAAADECVVDLVRRYGCVHLADVKAKCNAGMRALARMRREGKITITRDNRVCPK